jgi:two-component system cell cycle sensor histidine kinase/response regulator CckA
MFFILSLLDFFEKTQLIRFLCGLQLILAMVAFVIGQHFTCENIWLWVLLFAFVCGSIFVALFTYRFLTSMQKLHESAKIARSFLSIASELDEILILDASLTICYAKHWSVPPTDRDFSFENLVRSQFVDHNSALDLCKQSIESATYFEDVFQTVKVNTWDSECFIRVRVVPLYTKANAAPAYRAIILSDVTLYKSVPKDIPQALVKYIDAAPFGLLYINSAGNIIGLNETLQQWLHVSKNKTIGKHLSTISSVTPADVEAASRSWVFVTLNTRSSSHTQVCLFTSKISDECYALTFFKPNTPSIEDLLSSLPIPSLITDNVGKIRFMNPIIQQKYDMRVNSLFNEYLDNLSLRHLEGMLTGSAGAKELRLAHLDVTLMTCIHKWKNEEFIFQLVDTSEQKKLEQQFIQSQKTQAVGQLAGGIAHDFNNLLTAITGFSDMLLQRIMPNDPSYADIMQIKQNANRASNLVKQLLAFSRRQPLQPRTINVASTLADLSALIKRLIGAPVSFKLAQKRHLWQVKVDSGQFEQVIINLAVNARDAMPKGGTLTIESSNYTVASNQSIEDKTVRFGNKSTKSLSNENIPTGDYVLIKVSDTGCGIPRDMMGSIFEPFFSTKEVGQGTGLGLATAYGIVKQTGGFIFVESDVGVGTTFHIYLPRCNDSEEEPVKEKKLIQDLTGTETIMLVEDDEAVRLFATRALRDRGYRVIDAPNGQVAIEHVTEGMRPDVLVTDVSMPGMDGPTLGKKISEIIPNIPIIFTSGYAEETFRRDLSENKSMHFLPKPFTLRDLASKIREILG